MAYSGELGHNAVPVMFHHFILNTHVFTSLLRPEEDQLWLKHISHVHIHVHYLVSTFLSHQVTSISMNI